MTASFPIVFDALKPSVERILEQSLHVQVGIAQAVLLTDAQRRNRVWRITLDRQRAPLLSSVIVKQVRPEGYDPENPAAPDTQRFFSDWAGAQFVSEVCRAPHGPHFYGGDRRAGFIVLEDLGEHHSLVEPLLAGDRSAAMRALMAYVRRLGRLHAEAMGHEGEFDAIVRVLRLQAPSQVKWEVEWAGQVKQHLDPLIVRLDRYLAELGLTVGAAARGDIHEAFKGVFGPSPFRTFIHTDPCPDNVFYDGETMRIFDFEFARFGNALLDGLYCRVPFPTCWCANCVPLDVVAQVEQEYRVTLAAACPAALDDELFYAGVAAITAHWACVRLAEPEETLKEDHQWGIAGVRARLLTQLTTFVEAARLAGRFVAFRATCEQVLVKLAQRWPDAYPLPYYPAFR